MRTVLALVMGLMVSSAWAQESDDAKYEEVLQKLVAGLGEMTKVLELVVDEDTAKSNTSALRVQAEAFIESRKMSRDLAPPSAQVREKLAEKYRPEFEKARKEILAQIARVQRVPGGNVALQEIRGVFEKDEKK